MTTMKDLEKKLRRLDYSQAKLYLFCNFISLLLITAYSVMMLSPTVLTVFPEGGDSRKQMTAIFVLAVVGCVAFTVYATALFFRKKAKQLGILMALGISKGKLAPILYREILVLSFLSSVSGILAGIPFVVLLWNSFRLFLVDSRQMIFRFRAVSLVIPVIFLGLVIGLACVTAKRYLARTDILNTIQEEHKNEPVKELGRWCGPVGIFILLTGAFGGYFAPTVYMTLVHAYPVWWLNLFYIPVFIGLYMILLHTVVYGWRGRGRISLRSNLISYSLMKFQGKQTVNNMLVSTVLTAGACFAIFYVPILVTGMQSGLENRFADYLYHYRGDQRGLSRKQVEKLASEYGLTLKDWRDGAYISLGMDGMANVGEGNRIEYQYEELFCEGKFFSESGFLALTGEEVSVEPGTYLAVTNEDGSSAYRISTGCTLLTNMDTRESIATEFAGLVPCNLLVSDKGYYVLDDGDYAAIAKGISEEWSGKMHTFNVDGEDDYQFADRFFRTLATSFDESCDIACFYDRVQKTAENERGQDYWGDRPGEGRFQGGERLDDADFRLYWEYMPKSTILERTDFVRTFSVFLMMFLFIFLICVTAACVICYTRCQTIALNNRYVFEDLRKLGAPPAFLKREIKKQCMTVIRTPSVIGITAMSVLYAMILYANDGRLVKSELIGLGGCGLVILGVALLLYIVYKGTVRMLVRELVEKY